MPFDPQNEYHMKLLLRIYTIFKGESEMTSSLTVKPPDWESLGF
jgi:hypothetical protein